MSIATATQRAPGAHLFLMIGALYFSGHSLGVAMEALPTLLRRDGADLHALAWLPLVGLPWVLKFLWSPVIDNRWRPALGRRRSWILPMQGVVLACLLALAALGVSAAGAGVVVALMALASLASATQYRHRRAGRRAFEGQRWRAPTRCRSAAPWSDSSSADRAA